MKKFLIFIFILFNQPAFSEITFEKKKLLKNFDCGETKFGFENTINSKNQKITVWASLSDDLSYSLPISIVSGKSDKDFKSIFTFYNDPIKYKHTDGNTYNLITGYVLFDQFGDQKSLTLASALYELDEKTINNILASLDYLYAEYDDKKYIDKLIENFLFIEKALSEKEPVQNKVTRETCILNKL